MMNAFIPKPSFARRRRIPMTRTLAVVFLLAILLLSACSKATKTEPRNTNQAAEPPAPAATTASTEAQVSPLMSAVNTGSTADVRQLIASGADVNAANEVGLTPLMNAAGMGNKEMVQMLLAKGANVNAMTTGKYTALMSAALTGQTEIVKLLLDAGADPRVIDVSGKSAAKYAEDQKHKELAQLLNQRSGKK
jgi:ankyrin repeat protein